MPANHQGCAQFGVPFRYIESFQELKPSQILQGFQAHSLAAGGAWLLMFQTVELDLGARSACGIDLRTAAGSQSTYDADGLPFDLRVNIKQFELSVENFLAALGDGRATGICRPAICCRG